MLHLSQVVVSFSGSRVLNGISCSLRRNETVGIIGPNGSGKTTLFNCISGFTPIESGGITLGDQPIHHLSPHSRARRGLGRVFQNFGIFREMSLLENMLVALESATRAPRSGVLPWSKATLEMKQRAMELLREIRLEDKALIKAGSLSGGQMRLLEIMRTVAVGAELFLLDEPTAGVSPRMKDDVAETIQKLQGMGKTVLIIEHDINFIQKFCSRIIVLNEGLIVLDDTPERVRSNEQLKEIYFGRGDTHD
jgi:branched-chain amino acid transport system ATP-binding protein